MRAPGWHGLTVRLTLCSILSIVQQTTSAAGYSAHRSVRQGMDGPFRLTFDELNTCAVDGSVGPVSTAQYPRACRWLSPQY
jgi:hypothetical protein